MGTSDLVFITLDTLRFDVATAALRQGQTPHLQQWLPEGWERRHSPGSFTFAAHQAFFAGFLPTPATPGPHARHFAARFPGSETTTTETFVFEQADIVSGLAAEGYHTICVGGVGFFNQQSPLGRVLPSLFAEAHWSPKLGVTEKRSTEYQVDVAVDAIRRLPTDQRVFLFVNVSALHQPNCLYVDGASQDSPATQQAALSYVDTQLPRLIEAMRQRASLFAIVCSDHGTTYGEDGYTGHRLAHPVVWDVPYAEFFLPQQT